MSVARPENAVTLKCNASPEFCVNGTLAGEDSDMNVQATEIAALDHHDVAHSLPVPCGTVAVEHPLRDFLLKRMFTNLTFVDRNPQTWPRVWSHRAGRSVYRESFFNDVLSPWDIVVDCFADDVAGLGETKFQRRCGADRSLWIVRCQCNSVRIRQCGDAT
jgi:hypothetical protein